MIQYYLGLSSALQQIHAMFLIKNKLTIILLHSLLLASNTLIGQTELHKEYIKECISFFKQDTFILEVASRIYPSDTDEVSIHISKFLFPFRVGSTRSVLKLDYDVEYDPENFEAFRGSHNLLKYVHDSLEHVRNNIGYDPSVDLADSIVNELSQSSEIVLFFSPIFKSEYISCRLAVNWHSRKDLDSFEECMNLMVDQGNITVFTFKFNENQKIEKVYTSQIHY